MSSSCEAMLPCEFNAAMLVLAASGCRPSLVPEVTGPRKITAGPELKKRPGSGVLPREVSTCPVIISGLAVFRRAVWPYGP